MGTKLTTVVMLCGTDMFPIEREEWKRGEERKRVVKERERERERERESIDKIEVRKSKRESEKEKSKN